MVNALPKLKFIKRTLKKKKLINNNLIERYHHIFAVNKNDIGCIQGEMAKIILTNETPITCRPYRCTEEDQIKIDNEINRLLKIGFIRKIKFSI